MLMTEAVRARSGSLRFLEWLLLVAAAGLLVGSLAFPYWSIVLRAPQYPHGLRAVAFTDRVAGDVEEIDTLNHYIGMMPLGQAAPLERYLVRYAVPAIAALALASAFLRGTWMWLLRAPLILFPAVFAVDLSAWLRYAGHHLDPKAALSSSIRPFTPPLLGESRIAQFSTVAGFEIGFYLSLAAALLAVIAGLMSRRNAARDAGWRP